ncbi:thioredoxin family protein [Metapseudomonas furukawaii]|jgi:thioredoxin-like negative regulator of GroEL|uniref:Thiol-disulfide isomerase and thioredoxins n=1 Tax=Metapseudomonas furukawaii TaxID=1149133 RepID=A0AAD1C4H2_METFU|nr:MULTISPECIES: thioredoxin family protein [Pseudomonas]ELS29851.1 putative thioredoxin [Pseudomonas furukawaii]OWJ95398.1 thiol reductase thioredoxin [Pseudomonas sp. A46]WAG79043.1 thioredoxin family protein [Pseudomonas furukawaii]BAU77329.1 thiol-disulfide isomerase and thioredoxins [Pseudomonas furukawaii]
MSNAAEFFARFPIQRVRASILDDVLASERQRLVLLYLWQDDCPLCDVAKHDLLRTQERCQWPQVRWLHDEVAEDPALALRFGLHGVPTFVALYQGRPLGRITSWPGSGPFIEAIERLLVRQGLA